MTIRLSDHFTPRRLLRFTLPSIVMSVFISIYCAVDGLFVSNFAGVSAFASLNIIFPFLSILGGIGAMFGVGGSALVSKTLGEGNTELANRYFTMVVRLLILTSVATTIIGCAVVRPVAYLLGATDELVDGCVLYGRTFMIFNAAMHLQYTFQNFLVVAERPNLGLAFTIAAGLTNIVLDALFVAVFEWGLFGAALATGLAQLVGGVLPLVWFLSKKNTSPLHFVKTKIDLWPVLKSCGNGFSEMLGSVSGAVTGLLYNRQLMAYSGEAGVAAYGAIMYATFLFISAEMGFSCGASPVIGYHYGADNKKEMRGLLRIGIYTLFGAGMVFSTAASAFSKQIAMIFLSKNPEILDMAARGLRISAFQVLLLGFAVFISSYFTALNNGVVSAILSGLRTLVFPVTFILLLPLWFGLDGIWYSIVVSEICSLAVAGIFLLANRKKYGY